MGLRKLGDSIEGGSQPEGLPIPLSPFHPQDQRHAQGFEGENSRSYMEGIEETIEQLPIEEALYRLPDMEELLRVIRGCGNDKAPDEDGLCAEAFKALAKRAGSNEFSDHPKNFQITRRCLPTARVTGPCKNRQKVPCSSMKTDITARSYACFMFTTRQCLAGAIETAMSALDNAHLTNTYGSEATFGWLILPRHQLLYRYF